MPSDWFEVDASTGNLRITAIDPSLFMRLGDLIDIISEDTAEEDDFPADFLRLLDSRLMRTLQTLHADKKVHGDVSPDNVVVTHFGGCSLLHPTAGPPALHTIYNTPFVDALSPAHDVFGVGCLLFTIATRGNLPFHGRTAEELRCDMARGCPIVPSYVPTDIAELIRTRINAGLDPRTYQAVCLATSTKLPSSAATTAMKLPTQVDDVSFDEVVAALGETLPASPPSSSRSSRSPAEPKSSPNSGRSRSAAPTSNSTRSSPKHTSGRVVEPPMLRGASFRNSVQNGGIEVEKAVPSRMISEERYISPILAKKMAAAARHDSKAGQEDPYEQQLAAARIEAFKARVALANKHAQVINPVAPVTYTTADASTTATLVPLPIESSRVSDMHSDKGALSARTKPSDEPGETALEKARKEYFEARMAMKARQSGADAVNSSVMSADSLNETDVSAAATVGKRLVGPRTPPSRSAPNTFRTASHSQLSGASESAALATSVTPQQLRAARVAAEQRAYEESLTAARRQAFEDRVALQSRYGRGV